MTNFPPGPDNPRQTFMKFQADPLGYLCELANTYGGIVHYRLVTSHVYLINDPDLVREVLVEKADKFDRTDHTKETLGRFLGNGLLVSAGDFHHHQRRIMQPLFTPARIAEYAPSAIEQTEKVLATWQHGEVRDIAESMMALTLTITAQAIFGADLSGVTEEIGKTINLVQRHADNKMRRGGIPVSDEDYQSALNSLDQIIADLIIKRRDQQGSDFLSRLATSMNAETGQLMSDKQIRDEITTLLLGGYETTANLLSWTLYLLAANPDLEIRLVDELNAVIGNRLPASGDIFRLPYTEMVIKEAMRLYPPGWLIGRQPIGPVDIGGYTIQPNASIAISPYVLHRTASYFDNPETFAPERFTQEPARYSYIPFGGGPHVCLGQSFSVMEATLILAAILPRFRFELMPEQIIEPDPLITLRPKHGIQVRVIERELLPAQV